MNEGLRHRVLKGFLWGCLVGTGFLVFGLAMFAVAVLIGVEEFSFSSDAQDVARGIAILAPLYILSFGLAGGIMMLLWNLTSGWLGALVVGNATAAIIIAGASVSVYLVSLVESDVRIDDSPRNILKVCVYALVMGCVLGLMLRWARKKQADRDLASKDL
ncbi:MAG: hypothetical protein IMZ54_10860 [Acidobacteria bacterium]|nr:hypothetical protein [Planctomycetota bacterium]MBE3131197.1 hypothetical protein [Acidobacteriota bacterium]